MSRSKKVIRTKRLYKKRRGNKKVRNTILFILALALLIFFGYIIGKEWGVRFGKDAVSSVPSSEITSNSTSSDIQNENSSQTSSDTVLTANLAGYSISAKEVSTFTLESMKSIIEKAKSEGYSAVSIEVKDDEGMIYFNTANEMAKKYGAVSEKTIDLTQFVNLCNESKIMPVVKLTALRDNKAAHVKNENSYAYSTFLDVNWLDDSPERGGKAWLNPYMENTRRYIGDLCQEISKTGVKTIILDDVIFPEKYTKNINTINETMSKPAILEQLLKECQDKAGDIPVIRELSLNEVAVTSEKNFENEILSRSNYKLGLKLNLDIITKNKEAICLKAGIANQDGIENISIPNVAKALMEQAKANAENGIIIMIRNEDFEQLKPILNELKIEEYMIGMIY